MEAYGRLGEDTIGLVEDLASSAWVLGEWSKRRGLQPQAVRVLYRGKVLAELSTRLMQTTVGACIMYRLRSRRTAVTEARACQAALRRIAPVPVPSKKRKRKLRKGMAAGWSFMSYGSA